MTDQTLALYFYAIQDMDAQSDPNRVEDFWVINRFHNDVPVDDQGTGGSAMVSDPAGLVHHATMILDDIARRDPTVPHGPVLIYCGEVEEDDEGPYVAWREKPAGTYSFDGQDESDPRTKIYRRYHAEVTALLATTEPADVANSIADLLTQQSLDHAKTVYALGEAKSALIDARDVLETFVATATAMVTDITAMIDD